MTIAVMTIISKPDATGEGINSITNSLEIETNDLKMILTEMAIETVVAEKMHPGSTTDWDVATITLRRRDERAEPSTNS